MYFPNMNFINVCSLVYDGVKVRQLSNRIQRITSETKLLRLEFEKSASKSKGSASTFWGRTSERNLERAASIGNLSIPREDWEAGSKQRRRTSTRVEVCEEGGMWGTVSRRKFGFSVAVLAALAKQAMLRTWVSIPASTFSMNMEGEDKSMQRTFLVWKQIEFGARFIGILCKAGVYLANKYTHIFM